MFNIKKPTHVECNYHSTGGKPFSGLSSYVHSVKWSDFITKVDDCLDIVAKINDSINDYNIVKTI